MDQATRRQLTRAIGAATLVAGTLDILSAFAFNQSVGPVLRYVASGPFGDSMREAGLVGALLGLLVHYALMSIMVDILALTSLRVPALLGRWAITGIVYGLAIYGVMYWIVTPLRFDRLPTLSLWGIGNALFSHIACVGLPMAFVLRRLMPSAALPPAAE